MNTVFMLTQDDINYALENTRIVVPPRQRLSTFGTSLLNYHLITEDMDKVNHSRVREGQIHAEKPEILTPAYFSRLMLEGFGEKAQEYAQHISANPELFTFLKYGFRLKKTDIRTYDVGLSMAEVTEKIRNEIAAKDDPFAAILNGVDVGWEMALVKFMMDMVSQSAGRNWNELREGGLF
jgi:hypothetical protein